MHEQVQDPHLRHGLVLVAPPVADDLACQHLLRLVVVHLDHLAEGPTPQQPKDLVPVGQVVGGREVREGPVGEGGQSRPIQKVAGIPVQPRSWGVMT